MQRPTTVIMARLMALPGMTPMPSRLFATALAAICTVPKVEIMLTTRMRPAWNRLFSRRRNADARMRFAIRPSSRSVLGTVSMWPFW